MIRVAGSVIAFCAIMALPIPAGAEHPSCQPAPQLRAALSELDPRAVDDCERNDPCWLALIDTARVLAEEHPSDLHAQRTYQNLVHWWVGEDREQRIEEMMGPYEARAASRPEDPVAGFLVARFYDTPEEGIESANRLVEMAAGFPWGHTALAAILWSVSGDEAKPELGAQADDHLDTFMGLCPSRFQEPLTLRRPGGDPAYLRPHLARFREAIAASEVPTRLAYLPMLWRAEFKANPPERHAEVRDRLRDDLAAIARLERREDVSWWEVMIEGPELTGDREALESLSLDFAERFPCHRRAVQSRHEQMSTLFDGRPTMEEFSREEIRQVYADAGQWIAACPDEYSFHLLRFNAVRQRDDLSARELRMEADRLLQAWSDSKQRYFGYHGPHYEVAELLLEENLDADRVPGLVESEIDMHREQWDKQPLEAAPESVREMIRVSRGIVDVEDRMLLAEARLRLGHERRAEKVLLDCEERLAAIGDDDPSAGRLDAPEARLWGLKGDLAQSKGNLPDAFSFYRRAADLDPEAEWEQDATDAWLEMGGSVEGLTALIDSTRPAGGDGVEVAASTAWEETETPLNPFELVDLRGRSWTPGELGGGAILINVWATWCGPCRLELPHLQELHERLEDRKDVRVISLNVDSNPGLVAPFADRLDLTFPVLLGERYFYDDSPWGTVGIPQNWIVDAGGIIRWKSVGFPSEDAEGWVDETCRLLDRIATGRETALPETP